MNGEHPNPENHISLRDYVERMVRARIDGVNGRIDAVEKRNDERAEYMEKAVHTGHSVLAERLQSMNEFRAQMRDQQATYITQAEYHAAHEALMKALEVHKEQSTKELGDLRITSAIITTKASMGSVLVAYGISLAGLALALANYMSK